MTHEEAVNLTTALFMKFSGSELHLKVASALLVVSREAEARGRKEGLEEAAKVADKLLEHDGAVAFAIAREIRALSAKGKGE